jgi:hypothetical protein
VPHVLRIAESSVGVFSFWSVLSGSFCLFVILLLLASAQEARLDELQVDELPGDALTVEELRGIFVRPHFYLFSSSLPLREYPVLRSVSGPPSSHH